MRWLVDSQHSCSDSVSGIDGVGQSIASPLLPYAVRGTHTHTRSYVRLVFSERRRRAIRCEAKAGWRDKVALPNPLERLKFTATICRLREGCQVFYFFSHLLKIWLLMYGEQATALLSSSVRPSCLMFVCIHQYSLRPLLTCFARCVRYARNVPVFCFCFFRIARSHDVVKVLSAHTALHPEGSVIGQSQQNVRMEMERCTVRPPHRASGLPARGKNGKHSIFSCNVTTVASH